MTAPPIASGIAPLERAALVARERQDTLSDRQRAALGSLGLIALRIMRDALPDAADELVNLAAWLRM